MDAKRFEQITVSGVTTLTKASLASPDDGTPVRVAYVIVEGGPIRYRIDGGTPTTVAGMPGNAGDILEIIGINDIRNFKVVKTTTNDTILSVTYFY